MSRNVHEALVADKTQLAPAAFQYVLRPDPPEAISFRPGQFVSLRVGEDPDGNPILRSYSIASPPGQEALSLVIKLFDGGLASEWLRRLELGERVRFTGPMGFFVLDLQHPGDLVFCATGVGIAPVLPMAAEALDRDEPGRVLVYWGNRDPGDFFWQDELDELVRRHPRLQVRRFVSREAPGTGPAQERGRITTAVLAELERFQSPTFYLVGNGAMVRELRDQLIARGVDRKRQIRNEVFYG